MYSLRHRTTSKFNGATCLCQKPPTFTATSKRCVLHRAQKRRVTRVNCQRDKSVGEFQKLLNIVQSKVADLASKDGSSIEWFDNVESQGKALAAEVEGLRAHVNQKTTRLNALEGHLNEATEALAEAKDVQTSTEAQLKNKTNEVEVLKNELKELEKHRAVEVGASMERYRELEDALAHVESELKSQPEMFQGKEAGPVDVNKLTEIVTEQERVYQKLRNSLASATEAKHQAQNEAEETRRKTEGMKITQDRLQQDYDLLAKELSQLQILYAEKEIEWKNENQNIQELCEKLMEDTVGLETDVAIKDKRMITLEESLTDVKNRLQNSDKQLFDLRLKYVETEKENKHLVSELQSPLKTPQHQDFADLQMRLTKFEATVPVLEKEIETLIEKLKTVEDQFTNTEKENLFNVRRSTQLEHRANILKNSMEEKSNRLVAAHKERRSLKTEVGRLQMESNAFQNKLNSVYKELEKLHNQLKDSNMNQQMLEQTYQKEIASIAERSQEAQGVILYHQKYKNENIELNEEIAELKNQVKSRQQEMANFKQMKTQELNNLQLKIEQTEEEVKGKEAEILQIKSQKSELQNQLNELQESSKSKSEEKNSQIQELKQKVEGLEVNLKNGQLKFQELKGELSKLQNELGQRQRIISARDQEVVTLKDDARLANERVEALRAQIASMQTLNREMETEMADTDELVSKMNERMKDLQEESDEKTQKLVQLNQTLSEMEIKAKQTIDEFTTKVTSLEEYSNQQEGLVENYFEEKKNLEGAVDELKLQIKAFEEEKEESDKLLIKAKEECNDLKKKLETNQEELVSIQKSAAEEIKAAEKILEKAERVAQSVQGSTEEDSNEESLSSSEKAKFLQRISQLESALVAEQKASSDSKGVAGRLEMDVVALRKELKAVRESEIPKIVEQPVNGSDVAEENERISLSKRLSQSLAAEEAALSEIQQLKNQIKHLKSLNESTNQDEKLEYMRRYIQELQVDNEKLRKAANKRNQIIAQSRNFIQQYLERSVTSSMTDLQP